MDKKPEVKFSHLIGDAVINLLARGHRITTGNILDILERWRYSAPDRDTEELRAAISFIRSKIQNERLTVMAVERH